MSRIHLPEGEGPREPGASIAGADGSLPGQPPMPAGYTEESGPTAPLKRPLVDAHIHLEQYAEEERAAMLDESFRGGLTAAVAVSKDLDSSIRTRELALQYPGRVLPAYGWHPEQQLPAAGEIEELLAWIRSRHEAGEDFAIGEVGLPYYMRTEAEAAGEAFDESGHMAVLRSFAALAADTGRPLILHAVYEDAAKAAEVLREFGVRRAHFHWYKGDEAATRLLAEAGCYISVTPDVLYEEEIRLLASSYPLELLMTETDGPWPFEGPFAGRTTHPLMMRESVREIARLRGMDEQEVGSVLAANARRFYGMES